MDGRICNFAASGTLIEGSYPRSGSTIVNMFWRHNQNSCRRLNVHGAVLKYWERKGLLVPLGTSHSFPTFVSTPAGSVSKFIARLYSYSIYRDWQV